MKESRGCNVTTALTREIVKEEERNQAKYEVLEEQEQLSLSSWGSVSNNDAEF